MNKVALLAIMTFVAASGAHAASFDCAKANAADEKAICSNPALNDADVKMATMFEMETKLMAMGSRDTLQGAQKEWLTKRALCKDDLKCLAAAYDQRLSELKMTFEDIVSRGPF